ncbi:FUSC family protein [Ancylobacter sp. A5.8]|uniref:FUSC family protein n=1 Tax=Ancylobacter gelatini TaxID=2919920 RepID=UPI001F4F0ED9|nr:FUSC family protein [Ancylobacter gelatini]MCJ8144971.1 FUSC family protein [Ancylobacter gelatini]
MAGTTDRPVPVAWPVFPLEVSWRNLAVSVRLALAAICALAIAYWLELQEPQWAILTVYLLTQSSAGAAFAKGAFRLLGTVIAAACGLLIVELFSQNPILLVGAAVLWIFACYYSATRMSNFAAYGFMLAGYTGLLVTFQGAADPSGAWSVAVNRATEIAIGIGCASLANGLVMPVYAGTQLRGLLAKTYGELAAHAALALKAGTPVEAFMRQRRDVLAKIVKFDALRSFAVFEARELRPDADALREALRESLATVAAARSLYLRLADFRTGGAGGEAVTAHLLPAIETAIATLERVSRGPVTHAGLASSRADLARARRRLAASGRDVEALAGSVPLALLADVTLILRRSTKMLRELSLLALATGAVVDSASVSHPRAGRRGHPAHGGRRAGRREALLQGTRSGLAVLIFCLFWYATEWDQGIAGITGLALMSYQCVNTDDPGKIGWPYFRAVIAACFCAYFVMAYVYPWLEGFGMLATFLLLVLVPLGLLIGTPRFGASAGTFTIYFVAAAATANVYDPDPLDFANFCTGLVFGMFVCLMVARLIPVTATATRRHAYQRAIGVLLPEAATGHRPARHIGRDIVDLLASVLSRLKLTVNGDEIFLRGMLASASSALELGRLRQAAADPAMPEAARAELDQGISRLARVLAGLPAVRQGREAQLQEGRETIRQMWLGLERLAPAPGSPAARAVLGAASSLRFLADRFELDQAFLQLALTD